jgi:predicted enzyme related to lactoylglutathione lyase
MPNIEKHESGDFSWIELGTTDQIAAKKFYPQLFGWAVNDFPMGPNDFYTMFHLQGRSVAAAYRLREDQKARGVPPHWMLYIAVANADAATDRAVQLGGKVLAPPFDVLDVGRMAVLQDPTGAVFAVWQAKRHTGTQIKGVDGALCWADLNTPDQDGAARFYSELFGWTIAKGDEDPGHNYYHIKNREHFIGGIPPGSPQSTRTPPPWLAYFHASNCDATGAKATQLGAKYYVPPTTFEKVGRLAVIADPQGAVFAIFQPASRL